MKCLSNAVHENMNIRFLSKYEKLQKLMSTSSFSSSSLPFPYQSLVSHSVSQKSAAFRLFTYFERVKAIDK